MRRSSPASAPPPRAVAAPERPFGNHFAVSASALATFDRCPRAWWISKVLFWRGWDRKAPPIRRLAYGLTKMDTVWSLAGRIVHEIAADEVTGRRRRDPAAAASYLDYRMKRAWNESQGGDWRDRPKQVVNLFEHYYRHPDALRLFGIASDRAQTAVRNLLNSPTLALARRAEVLEVEALHQMEVGDVPVWLQLDAAVRTDEDGLTWLIDWKTGKPRPVEDRSQALLYTLYYHDVVGVPADRLRVALVYLTEDRREVLEPQAAVLDAVRRRMVEQANRIRERLSPPGLVNSGDKSRFPPVDEPEICGRCELYHACKGSRMLPRIDRTKTERGTE